MFAHICGQDRITQLITQEFTNGELPHALLFYGGAYSGRMTTALETARIITCAREGLPACLCEPCRRSRILEHPYTIVFANRDFTSLIQAAMHAYQYGRNEAAKHLVLRSVQLLVKRFDPLFLQRQDATQKKLAVHVTELQQHLMEFSREDDRKADRQDRNLKRITSLCVRLTSSIKSGNIPVQAVRSVTSWLMTKPRDIQAVVILEGVEHFVDATKNALLKLLEEPPRGVTIMLLSEGKGRIIPTILSRVRKYAFQERSFAQESSIIRDVYYADGESYDSLPTFFLNEGGLDCRRLRDDAEFITSSMLGFTAHDYSRLGGILKQTDEGNTLRQMLAEMLEVVRDFRSEGRIDLDSYHGICTVIGAGMREWEEKNQKESLVLESCCYRIMRLSGDAGESL